MLSSEREALRRKGERGAEARASAPHLRAASHVVRCTPFHVLVPLMRVHAVTQTLTLTLTLPLVHLYWQLYPNWQPFRLRKLRWGLFHR